MTSMPPSLTKMKNKEYTKELRKLQARLCQMQEWVKHTGQRVIIVFEGRDTAGKGGHHPRPHRTGQPAGVPGGGPARTHRARADADVLAALRGPLPGGGRDRGVRSQLVQPGGHRTRDGVLLERAVSTRFLELCPNIEEAIVGSGIQLIKLWLEVGQQEQERRMTARIDDPLRQWKLSPMDLESWPRWYEYSRARDRMFEATDTKHAPWYVLALGRQAPGAAELPVAHPAADPLQAAASPKVKLPKRWNKHRYDDQASLKGGSSCAEKF